MYSVKLTADELVRLDGVCSADVQAEVDKAKSALRIGATQSLTPKQSQFVAHVVATANTDKLLVYSSRRIRSCLICDAFAGYATYKSGRNKGRANHDKPRHLASVELRDTFLTVDGHVSVGGCKACVDALLPVLRAELADVRAELPDQLRAEDAPRFKRYRLAVCTSCGWTGHEGLMRPVRALMGGTYPGGCAVCSASNKPFDQELVTISRDEFAVVEMPID
jgi:hypothetical protein